MHTAPAHEITLLAWSLDPATGSKVIEDIVQTSNRNAKIFARRWLRDSGIIAISTQRPGGEFHTRDIRA